MPYKILKRKNKYVVINKETGRVAGTHSSKAKATSQLRLLYGIEGGMKPRKKKK